MMDVYRGYTRHFLRANAPPDLEAARSNPARYAVRAPWLPRNKGAAVLDVGCGLGHGLLGLWCAGYRNLGGVDLSRDQIQLARRSLPGEIRLTRADMFSFLRGRKRKYDLITCFDVIEHLPHDDVLRLLRLIHASLRGQGCAVVRTGNMASILGPYIRYIDYTHRGGFTEFSLIHVLELAGFQSPRVVPSIRDMRSWRWSAPWRGLNARGFVVRTLHAFIYRLLGVRPMPQAFGHLVTVAAVKK